MSYSYSDIGAGLSTKSSALNDLISNDNADAMLDSWEGSTKESTMNKVNNIRTYTQEIMSDINNFKSAVDKLDEYKKNAEDIKSKQTEADGISEKKDKDGNVTNQSEMAHKAELLKEIEELKSENEKLKGEIEGIIASIQEFGEEAMKFFAKLPYLENAGSLIDLIRRFNNGSQVVNGTGDGRVPSDEFMNRTGITVSKMHELISEVKQNYSGREAVLALVYNFMEMCAEAKVRLNYTNQNGAGGTAGGSYIMTSSFLRGTDCCGSVSYLLNAALSDTNGNKGFSWRSVDAFWNLGTSIPSSELSTMQPGDIYVKGSDHVAMVIGVDVENKKFYTLDSADDVYVRSFSDVGGEVTIRDMTSEYDKYIKNSDVESKSNKASWMA